MPVVNAPLPEVDQLIARPAVFAVMEQIKKITNIPQDVEVTFPGVDGQRLQYDHVTAPGEAPVKLASDSQLLIEVDEQPDESMFTGMVGNRPEHAPDFIDPSLGVVFKPVYTGYDFVVSVIYRTPSRTSAIQWRNEARYKASQMRMVNLHELEYQYQLPRAAMVLLEHIHTLREKQHGYNQDFAEYLSQHLTTRATLSSTVVGTAQELMIREKQFRVQGSFDFTFNPERQDKNDGAGWEVRFTYTFSFHKPTEYSMRYPIVIHNQPLDPKFIPLEVQDPTFAEKRMAMSIDAMHHMEEPVVMRRITGYETIWRAPTFDTWTPDLQPPGQRILATFLLGLDAGFTGTLLNINQLGDYYLDQDVIKWIMAEEWRYLQLPHTSVVQVHLYRNECLSAPQAIQMDAQGNIKLLEPVDGRKRYRIVLSVAKKLSDCDVRSLKRLSRYPDAMCKLIKAIRTTTGELNQMLQYIDLSKFTSCAIKAGTTREQAINDIVTPKTVMGMAILADRIDGGSKESPGTQLKNLYPLL